MNVIHSIPESVKFLLGEKYLHTSTLSLQKNNEDTPTKPRHELASLVISFIV